MKTLSLALRNLARNYRRSIATLLAIIVGIVAILLFGGYSQDITYGLQTGYVQHNGHLQIQHKDYFLFGTGDPTAYGVSDYRRIISAVKHDPALSRMVTVVTPILHFGGIAGNFGAGVSRTILGTGVVVADQNLMREWNDYRFPVRARKSALTGTPENATVIGMGVARVLHLCRPLDVADCPQPPPPPAAEAGPGIPPDIASLAARERDEQPARAATRIELLAASAKGAPNVAELNVVKAQTQGVKELDDMSVVLHLSQAQRLVYGNGKPAVTAVVVQLHHTSQIPEARARLTTLLRTTFAGEPLEVQDFRTLNPFYGQAVRMFDAIFGFIFVLIGAIVLFTVSNTMSMAVVERTVEIGTLRAIGLRRGGIRRLFVAEGALLGILGAVVGVLVALLLAMLINHSGLRWTPPGRVEAVPLTVRVWGEWRMIALSALGLFAVAVLSAWMPARRGARLNIVDALRHA